MTMKRTELEKRKGLAIQNALKRTPARPDAPPVDRRAQRERDRAAGLVPFAIKLHGDLVRQLQQRAAARGIDLAALTDELLRQAMTEQKGDQA